MTDPPDETPEQATNSGDQTSVSDSSEWELQSQDSFTPSDMNSLVVTIVTTVADAEDVPAGQIDPPLQEVVDVEAISRSFATAQTADRERSLAVEFPYRDHRIVVRGDAWVQVYSKPEE